MRIFHSAMGKMSDRGRILSGLSAEVMFAVLPLVAVMMVVLHTRHAHRIFMSPEWAFGAAILFGQAIVKFVAGVARAGAAAPGPVTLLVTLVVVLGLAPSLLVLTLTLYSIESGYDPARWLQGSQVLLFLAGSAAYLILGTVGEQWTKLASQ